MRSLEVQTQDSIAALAKGLLGLLAMVLGSCSVVPDWTEREVRTGDVTVHYRTGTTAHEVSLPATTNDLLIESLISDPDDLGQRFTPISRHLRLPAGNRQIKVHCRYRMFRSHDENGRPLPWPSPEDLFPGADRIEPRSATKVSSAPED